MAKKKSDKLKARLPRGFVDRPANEIRMTDRMITAIRHVYELYGFDPVETPMFEYTDALGKFLPDQDRPNEGVFSLQDDDEQWMSLRYDLTAPLARHVAENYDRLPKPYRTYRAGYVFRNEKPGPGRFRQFMQFDADSVGVPNVSADAEICMMASDVMEKLGIGRGDYVIRVNNRKVLDGVMDVAGIGGEEQASTRLTVLRAVDKLDKFGPEGVRLLLGEGRMDESGDFTKGAGLGDEAAAKVIAFVEAGGGTPDETIGNLRALIGSSERGADGVQELADMAALFAAAGYESDRILIDPSVVRGLEYYTGPVFEAELTFEVTGDDGKPVRFGSVGGGGRYDGLVGRFRGEDVPATGFSVGVSRLLAALKTLGKGTETESAGPVVVLIMDRDRVADYQKMVTELRSAGIRSELYLGGSGMKAQMKYADRRNAPVAIIQGSDEKERGEVQVKDLIEGKRLSGQIEDNETWRASRPAQVTVPESDLISAVRDMLEAGE
ncbi:histidine--tRNA ligase [Coralliovum pocilloporae]|uniref:histidine--tRNA ligase n=1 Tax=Coralliovum pocilloporae TaxID=3066369 RepID=UPI003306B817